MFIIWFARNNSVNNEETIGFIVYNLELSYAKLGVRATPACARIASFT